MKEEMANKKVIDESCENTSKNISVFSEWRTVRVTSDKILDLMKFFIHLKKTNEPTNPHCSHNIN